MEYWSTIIVALLAMVGNVTGSFLASRKGQAIIAYRLEELEKKVNKHNNLIERVYKLEEHDSVVDEQIKVANHRIADLEARHI